jgi:hypothetical protein
MITEAVETDGELVSARKQEVTDVSRRESMITEAVKVHKGNLYQ